MKSPRGRFLILKGIKMGQNSCGCKKIGDHHCIQRHNNRSCDGLNNEKNCVKIIPPPTKKVKSKTSQ